MLNFKPKYDRSQSHVSLQPADILAVIVSFNGGSQPVELAMKLVTFVGQVLVVDNGSGSSSLELLHRLDGQAGITISYLPENRGIAHALNKGVAHASEMGLHWILTMDQDSVPDPGMISGFCAAVERDPTLRCLSPVIVDRGRARRTRNQIISYAITSGNLVHYEVYQNAGIYREELFIDGVDFDFSLRVRRAGYRIHLIADAILYHSLGDEKSDGILQNWYTNHSPVRRYYMFRNFLYLLVWYGFRFPMFSAKSICAHFMLLVMIFWRDPKPGVSYRYAFCGLRDALRGLTGRIPSSLLCE